MADLENFKLLGIALALGLLIGLERGWRERERGEGMRIAGLRTYGLISLLGGVSAMLAKQAGPLLIGFVFIALALILLVAYSKNLEKFEDVGITSVIASLLTFILGALAVFGHVVLASAAAVVTTLLLGFKPLLHGWVSKLDQQELEATLKLLLISVVMLPVLPDQGYGPWGVFNPYHVWWMVVLIAGISYLGYFAIRIAGDRHGPVVTGAFGGLVSSTAVSINLARLAKNDPSMLNTLAAGILTACATMFARTLLLASILNPSFFQQILSSMLVMSLFTYLFALLFWLNAKTLQNNQEVPLENPFQLGMALKFGLFLSVVMLLSKVLQIQFGDMGAYVLASISGVADVDPITLSMAQLSKHGGLDITVAGRAVLIAVTVNSGFKSLVSWVIGGHALGLRVGCVLASAILLGFLIGWRLL
ncbi:MgtC/SapB family protein [Methylomicrobium sp. Wu6]|uniref:MgtC/SapB family protein n=1 Tax=Methylomicrobium sp. Wu6 TaxID=3107928 RepID=UPI002DD686B9|nr:MgtC/SapB family protein [Methylomicrobium sp. Wu6]MEC4747492.1 MgtC/SapB family protein [Methylomicrobium sp. Wu6]